MIERLRGVVLAKTDDAVVLEVGGVGFVVEASAVTLRDVPVLGEQATLYTHLHVREDAIQLFGFSTEEERALFRLLIGVSKIGPRLALAALSYRRAPELKRAVASGDIALLASVPGIGRKTAERIVLELQEKMREDGLEVVPSLRVTDQETSDPLLLARSALVELGYTVIEADRLLGSLDPALPVEELVRLALGRAT